MTEQVIRLVGQTQRDSLLRIIPNLPLDGSLEVAIRKVKQVRSQSQNALMWAARMRDISVQAWVNGTQYSVEVWHEHLKREFLPEGNEPDLSELVKDPHAWQKWQELPNGDLVCIGSTTKLTKRGFSEYMTKVEAWATQELGVRFYERD